MGAEATRCCDGEQKLLAVVAVKVYMKFDGVEPTWKEIYFCYLTVLWEIMLSFGYYLFCYYLCYHYSFLLFYFFWMNYVGCLDFLNDVICHIYLRGRCLFYVCHLFFYDLGFLYAFMINSVLHYHDLNEVQRFQQHFNLQIDQRRFSPMAFQRYKKNV